MNYAIIAEWDADNKALQTNIVNEENKANELIKKLKASYPNAFYAPCPTFTEIIDGVKETKNLSVRYWIIDPAKKTITGDTSARTSDEAKSEMEAIRSERDNLLISTDWTANSDVTMSDAMKTYRQMLRDIPASNTVYADVDWGTKP